MISITQIRESRPGTILLGLVVAAMILLPISIAQSASHHPQGGGLILGVSASSGSFDNPVSGSTDHDGSESLNTSDDCRSTHMSPTDDEYFGTCCAWFCDVAMSVQFTGESDLFHGENEFAGTAKYLSLAANLPPTQPPKS